jgi:ABC-type glycerol-3-phosphate transport system substrate-binding protein
MKRNVILVLAIIICCITLSAAYSNNENTSDSSKKELRIAVAWRADTDNEFCTNMIEAFREAGVTVTVLPQVKAGYLDYDGNVLSTACTDAAAVFGKRTNGKKLRNVIFVILSLH